MTQPAVPQEDALFHCGTPGLARRMPLAAVRGQRTADLLRISVDERDGTIWLKLEGRATGIWAGEFERAWREMAARGRDSKKFGVDLRGVTHMDANARRVLSEIHRETGAEFLADSPITKFFAEEARRGAKSPRQED
jgi:hypothetical protein